MLPKLIINYKAYDEALGENSLVLSKEAKEISDDLSISIAVMPMFVDLKENARIIRCYAQTLFPARAGSYTGNITLNQILEAKAKGVVLNHSEKRLPFDQIVASSKLAKENGLDVIVCVENAREGEAFNGIESIDAIALEPKELIGSGRAVSKEKPREIEEALKRIDKPLYVGAGITNREDVEKSIQLGAFGILVASAIVKAKNRKDRIRELVMPFKKQ